MLNRQSPQRWDIWLAYVPFEENDGRYSRRPALVFQFHSETNEWFAFKMTSHAPRSNFPGEYAVQYWREAGLTKPTTIRLSKRFLLGEADFICKLGTLHPADAKQVIAHIAQLYPRQH